MYQILYNNEIIFDPRGMNNAEPGDQTLTATEAQLHLAVNAAGSLTFTLPAGNPAIDTIQRMTGTVKVKEVMSGDTVFLGRVTTDTLKWDGEHTYVCEGLLACLNDTLMPPYRFPDNYASTSAYQTAAASGNVVSYWLERILANHNAMCWDSSHKIQLGNVTVTSAGNTLARSTDEWKTTWETITGDLSGSELGGTLVARYDGDTIYLDYLAAITESNGQAVSFGENLIDFTDERDLTDMFNAIVPIGKDGLTCAAAANGYYGANNQYYKASFYIVTPASRNTYGNIVRTVEWSDVEDAAELVSRAVTYLDSATTVDTMTITAADLSGIDTSVARFSLAKNLTILSPPHGIRERYAIVELTIDLLDQVSTRITLGSRGTAISGSGGASIGSTGQNVVVSQSALTFDTTPTGGSTNPVTSDGIYTALSKKQDTLTFDTTPRSGSTNPVTSGGVYAAINARITQSGGTAWTQIYSAALNSSGVYDAQAASSDVTLESGITLSDYNLFLVIIAYNTNYTTTLGSAMVYVPDKSTVIATPSVVWYQTNAGVLVSYRRVVIDKENSIISWATGEYVTGTDRVQSSSYAIPVRILAANIGEFT